MNPSRSLLLLAGVALLGALADAQTSYLGATGKTARGISQSLQQSNVATYQTVTNKLTDAPIQERPARVLASPQAEGHEGGGAPSQLVGARSNAEPPAPAGNPLWAVPLERLSITRDRPIFSPTRRPPTRAPTYVAPMAVRQPTTPPEPERPAVSLIGTVIGTEVQIGIFLEKATQNVFRLHLGEEHQGWVLRLVKEREVTLVKDVEQTLALDPPPGEAPAVRGLTMPPLVPNSIGTIPVVSTADYVDEQPLPKAPQRQRH
jgi:hypothetical protein